MIDGMMNSGFRTMARDSLSRANMELASNDPERLKYAALELRFAMEAVTYDRALAFKKEIPPEEYNTWQPRKLMQRLHKIDPTIAMTATIRIWRRDDIKRPTPQDKVGALGKDVVFTLDDLKKHYDAIGSYLHMPTLEQILGGKTKDLQKLRKRCEDVAELLYNVLKSQIYNCTLGNFTLLDQCMNNDCKKPIRKRIPFGKEIIEARCFECKAEYSITCNDNGSVIWEPRLQDVECPTEGCSEKMRLWPHEVRPGVRWKCCGCGHRYGIELMVSEIEEADEHVTN